MSTASPPKSLTAQCEEILADIKRFEQSASGRELSQTDRAERLRLVQSLDKLALRLKDPREAIFDQFTNFVETCNLRGLLELKVPETIPRNGRITAKELAGKVGADESLIVRLMRILTVKGIFDMVGPDEYAHTPFSLAYLDGHEVDFFKLMCDEILVNTSRLPEYFREVGGKDATSITSNPYSWGNGKDGQTFFQIISQDERRLKQFDIAMSTQDFVLPVLGMYPFGEELAGLPDTDTRALLVDIGGGRGQSLIQIRQEWPNLEGKFILQDRPMVLDSFPEIPGVEKMAHDFFTLQPVKHAHAYYIRRCFHNWTDAHCTKILQQIVPAMAPDSRVLIGEMVVPEYGSERPGNVEDMACYWMDHAMFTFGGRERTESDWKKLFESAGLRLVKVWRSKAGSQTVLEAKLPAEQ
ncbi:hypothetical protein MPDQ_000580 [Monascus purpureus]|uniref:Uncharacterized protein n=1 Tax=Monascus purpureus TaxID=5098 RepID=A0A507R4N9_MONPU|nr:hypothetical protein MPDQ_000580 [Monascus purpureus]BDD64164.1 hypothetical protein MAP00_009008 [Monascus purpureus]